MKISELIERLTRMRERLGDVEVQAISAHVVNDFDWYEITDVGYDTYEIDSPSIVELSIRLLPDDD
jgi:hypothetical protein